jgi:hypothetical protein
VQIVRETDRLEAGISAGVGQGPLDLKPLLGTWDNTNPESEGIVKLIVSEGPAGLRVRVFGAGSPQPVDWGEVAVDKLFGDALAAMRAAAFTARFDRGFLGVHVQGNQNLGLLVVASFNRFQDGSGRSDFFAREFFYR